jgi:hypothetical protein
MGILGTDVLKKENELRSDGNSVEAIAVKQLEQD